MEIWKDVEGFEGLYQVSNFGNVKSIRSGKNLSYFVDKKGYVSVHFSNHQKEKRIRVHRLVACAFIPNPNGLPHINHKDENKENNAVENLEWCDLTYNNNYGTRNKRISESRKLQQKKILQFTKCGIYLCEWNNAQEASELLNICKSGIYRCCEGIYTHAGGYVWKYKKEA